VSGDQTTIRPEPTPRRERLERGPALTVAWHPDLSRVGARLRIRGEVALSRNSPDVGDRPLGDPHLSRKPVVLRAHRGGLQLEPHPSGSTVTLDGAPCRGARLSAEALARGAVLGIAGRVLLVLHLVGDAPGVEGLGLVGRGLDAVRRQVLQVADLEVPVLIRGESGTGKERVAHAIHHRSARSGRPFVAVNLGALPPATAAAELFGHTRGAFTGAARERPGLFGRARGGTLFLDEVGEAPAEVQVALLRALETGEVRPVGSERTRPADVRLLAATDMDLESAVSQGLFRGPLLHRLAGFEIALSPLRERRQDIGPLLAHFLRVELDAVGELNRLTLPGPAAEPWLPAPLVSGLLRADWPGNVRQLRNAIRQLVIASRGLDQVVRTPAIERMLTAPVAPAPAGSPAIPGDEAMFAALQAADYRPSAAASALGVSKTTLYAWMERTPGVHKARDLNAADIEAARRAVGEDRAAMARHLRVSKRGLTLRMGELEV